MCLSAVARVSLHICPFVRLIPPTSASPRIHHPSTWPQRQETWLQPPFFSTGLPHFGQGFVLAVSQFLFSLSPRFFCFHCFHLRRRCHALRISAWANPKPKP
jgi:hypothetical protein